MDLKTIKSILDLISESDVNEVEIEEGNFKIKIKKQADTIYKGGSAPVYLGKTLDMEQLRTAGVPGSASSHTPEARSTQPGTDSSMEEDSGSEGKYVTVRSPIVGTFYRSPSPESESFINEGDVVKKGDILCIIEAMKIMNEIESEFSGKIVKILAENTRPVEFDQPLFLIDPS